MIANGAQVTVPTAVELDEKAELDQVNVLYSFLENRYGNKVGSQDILPKRPTALALTLVVHQFPLSKTFMEPASNPTYYKDLMNELHEAPRRSWFGSMVKRWKGFLRFS